MTDNEELYLRWHPQYFETHRRGLWFYERLWSVLLDRLGEPQDEDLIEFGSGPGYLLKLAWRRGWRPTGIEPSETARAHARSLGAWSIPKLREPWDVEHYRAAIATEVLEHVDDPKATLMEWHGTLVQGGLLALSVPNDNNPLQRLFGKWISPNRKTPKHWIHPTHKSYFNPRSLRELLHSAGFEVVWQRTSFPVELLLVIPFLSRHTAWKLSRLWPAPPFLWRFHVGRHCLIVARKTTT